MSEENESAPGLMDKIRQEREIRIPEKEVDDG